MNGLNTPFQCALSVFVAFLVVACGPSTSKHDYIGEWRDMAIGRTMIISDNGGNLLIRDNNLGGVQFTGTIDQNGDLMTNMAVKFKLDKSSGQLVGPLTRYERVNR